MLAIVWRDDVWDTVGHHPAMKVNVRELRLWDFGVQYSSSEVTVSVVYYYQE